MCIRDRAQAAGILITGETIGIITVQTTTNEIKPVIEVERRIYLDTKKTIESLDPMMATQEPLLGTIVRRIGWKTKYSSGSCLLYTSRCV